MIFGIIFPLATIESPVILEVVVVVAVVAEYSLILVSDSLAVVESFEWSFFEPFSEPCDFFFGDSARCSG